MQILIKINSVGIGLEFKPYYERESINQSSEGLREKNQDFDFTTLTIKRSIMSLLLGLETDRELCKSLSLEIHCKD